MKKLLGLLFIVGCGNGIVPNETGTAVYIKGDRCTVNYTEDFYAWEAQLQFCHDQWAHDRWSGKTTYQKAITQPTG